MLCMPRVNNGRREGHFVTSTAAFVGPEQITNVAGEGVQEKKRVVIIVMVVVAPVASLVANCITV